MKKYSVGVVFTGTYRTEIEADSREVAEDIVTEELEHNNNFNISIDVIKTIEL
jgi:hypothetical protein